MMSPKIPVTFFIHKVRSNNAEAGSNERKFGRRMLKRTQEPKDGRVVKAKPCISADNAVECDDRVEKVADEDGEACNDALN